MAKQKRVKAILSAEDRGATRTFSKFGGVLKGVGVAAVALGAIALGRKLVGGIGAAVDAADVQRLAETRLAQAIHNTGGEVEELLPKMREYASALQDMTGIGDEVILGQQAILKNMGATEENLQGLTQAALDLSVGLDLELKQAFEQVGRTLGGMTGRLSQVIPELKELTVEQLKAGKAADVIAAKFGGNAAAKLKTYGGAVDAFAGRMGDLQEVLGGPLAEVGTVLLNEVLSPFVKELTAGASEADRFRLAFFDMTIAALQFAQKGAPAAQGAFALLQAGAGQGLNAVGRLIDVWDQLNDPTANQFFADAIKELQELRDTPLDERLRAAAEAAAAAAAAAEGFKEHVTVSYGEVITLGEAVQQLAEYGADAVAWPDELGGKIKVMNAEVLSLGYTIQRSIRTVGVNAAQQLGDTLVDAAFGAETSFEDFFRGLAKQLAGAIVQAFLLKTILSSTGFFGGLFGAPAATATAASPGIGFGPTTALPSDVTTYLVEQAARGGGAGGDTTIMLSADIPLFVEQLNTSVQQGTVRVIASDLASPRTLR